MKFSAWSEQFHQKNQPQDDASSALCLTSETDGFIIGIMACPEIIPLSSWLSKVWGHSREAEALCASDEVRRLNAATERFQAVASTLHTHHKIEPHFACQTCNRQCGWDSWLTGFGRALALRSNVWGGFLGNADAEAFGAIQALALLEDAIERRNELLENDIHMIDRAAPIVIKHCVVLLMRKSRPEYFEEFTAGDLPIAENVFGPVTVWCRSFDHVMCSKGDEPWAQAERMNFARTRCGSR
jgi:uncharacterized protein